MIASHRHIHFPIVVFRRWRNDILKTDPHVIDICRRRKAIVRPPHLHLSVTVSSNTSCITYTSAKNRRNSVTINRASTLLSKELLDCRSLRTPRIPFASVPHVP